MRSEKEHHGQGRRLILLLALLVVLPAGVKAQPGNDWPRYGHDGALTARSPLKGRISAPRVAWTFDGSGSELLVELTPGTGSREVTLAADRSVAAASAPARRIKPPEPMQLDLDGAGALRPVTETFHERWAKILPDVKGCQRVAWSHTWTDQKVCRLQLFAYDQGFDKPRLVWQTDPPEDTIFNPLNIVHDVDGDGAQEICVAAHYRVMIFDGATGGKETELRYHGSRPYGWFGLFDIDADGRMEFITIGDFQSHIDVLTYDPAKPEKDRLAVKWRRDIEPNIEERRKWPQVGPRPVVDVTGDGRPEIVLSMYNDTGDGQWHAVVLDSATGKSLHDLPRRFVQGSTDVDGAGGEELFLMATDGVLVPPFGRAELVRLSGGAPEVLWSRELSGWAIADWPWFGPNWSTTATSGMRHVLVTTAGRDAGRYSPQTAAKGSRPAFLVMERAAGAEPPFATSLAAMQCDTAGRLLELWRVEGFPGQPEAVALGTLSVGPSQAGGSGQDARTPGVGALIRFQLPVGGEVRLKGQDAEPRVVDRRAVGVTPSTPVAALLRPGGPMTVVAEGAAQRVYAIEPPTEVRKEPRLAWSCTGRGMSDGGRCLGPLAADLDGDGGCEVVIADQTASGQAELVACRYDGSVLWRLPFTQTLGLPPVWNIPALTFWWPGHFRQKDRLDLFVNTRRGPMHSDVGQLVDGRTGSVVWRQEKAVLPGEFKWGYAGTPPAVADVNGDGLDEIVSLYPVCFWVADGRTGNIIAGKDLASQKVVPAWAAYGEPMVRDFTGQGRPEVLLDSPYILALLDTAGKPLWHGLGRAAFPTKPGEGNSGQVTQVRQALCDIDGDGVFETASAGYADGVRLIDPREGKVLWSAAAPTPTCGRVVAADIDGRKGDEILYPAGNTLVAVTGDRSVGRVLWTWKGPANLSMPAIADVDGDGKAEAVVQAADGTVFCLDDANE